MLPHISMMMERINLSHDLGNEGKILEEKHPESVRMDGFLRTGFIIQAWTVHGYNRKEVTYMDTDIENKFKGENRSLW